MTSRFVQQIEWADVPHLSQEQKDRLYAAIPPYQRDARTKGVPQLGSGAIYPVSEDLLLCDPFAIQDYFPQCYALDVGWKVTAGLWGAVDPNTDILYLYSEHYVGETEPPIHAAAIRARGTWIPGVIDPAARGRGQRDGQRLMTDYVNLGLDTLTASENALEAGIYEVWTRMATGRLKVFRTLTNWCQEFRLYQRDERGRVKDGQPDHLMDCTRYMVLSGLARATVRPPSLWTTGKSKDDLGHTSNYDPLPQ